MSWDNVSGISSIQFFAGTGENTSASLFLNGQHQIPLTVYISFSLTGAGSGPTQDEVNKAITLIDDKSEKPLSTSDGDSATPLISSTVANAYTVYYGSGVGKPVVQDDPSSFMVSFYVRGSSTATPTDAPTIALEIKYLDIDYKTSSISSGAIKTKVTIDLLSSKDYSKKSDANSDTPILLTTVDITSSCSYSDQQDTASGIVYVWKSTMTIGDSTGTFFLHDVEYDTSQYTPSMDSQSEIYPIFIYGEKEKSVYTWYYNTYVDTFFHGMVDNRWDRNYNFCEGKNDEMFFILGTIKIPSSQSEAEYIWYHVKMEINNTDYSGIKLNQSSNLTCNDQYGNTFYVRVTFSENGPSLDTVSNDPI